MQTALIHLLNWSALIIVLIGVPAVTSIRLGKFQIGSSPEAQMLTLAGLGLAAAVNIAGAIRFAKGAKARRLCWKWAGAMVSLWGIEFLYFRGHIHFDWLKEFLLSLRDRIRG